jgi:hypothetical protein
VTEVERLMARLPPVWRVVIQPDATMGSSWGATWFWPRREIWIAARDEAGMKASLLHEISHALLPPGEGHSARWEALCRGLWREVFGEERPGFAEHVACHLGR